MAYVPVEKVTKVVVNKYEAVVVAAREARKINSQITDGSNDLLFGTDGVKRDHIRVPA